MIKLMQSTFYEEDQAKRELAGFLMRTDRLSMGEECRKFEQAFALKQGRRFAVFVSSGSMANLVLVQSLLNLGRVKKGGRVGVSALTWATNVMPILQLGLEPVAVDCELETLNISPSTLREHINNLQALFLTNVLGFCDDLQEIEKICREHNVLLIEDNCEALGSKAFGRLLGNFGVASTFSFFVGHHISTIEGGMVCTDDEDLYRMLVMVRAHGWDRDLPSSDQQKLREDYGVSGFYGKYTFYELAYNARPTEVSGFLGNQQLVYWDEIVGRREANFNFFRQLVNQNSDFIPLQSGYMEVVSNFAMPVICRTSESADFYRRLFSESGVEIRPLIAGDITQQPFYKKYATSITECPNARLIHKNGFYFPNHPELQVGQLNLISSILKPRMQKDSKIFVAGHNGLVGSAVVRRLLKDGYNNLVLRTRQELDLTNQQAVREFFEQERPEYVIDCAARVGGVKANMEHLADFLNENLQIQNNLIWYSHLYGVKKFLFLGSSCIYPREVPQPIKEDYFLTGKFEPTNEGYAVAKVAGMKFCEMLYKQYGKSFISCMPTNIYGINDNYDPEASHVIPGIMRRMHAAKMASDPEVVIWGSGNVRREFLYSDDLADAVVWLMQNYDQKEFINVGTGEDVSIRELAYLVKEVVGYRGELMFDTTKPEGMPRKLLDVSRLHATGWRHKTPLREGLEKMYQDFLNIIEKQNATLSLQLHNYHP